MVNYEINAETLLIVPFSNGKSKVYEFDNEYIIQDTSLGIIKKTGSRKECAPPKYYNK